MIPNSVQTDTDADGVGDICDNCLLFANPNQIDTDADGFGNPCDGDLDNNNIVNVLDLNHFRNTFGTSDAHADFNSDGIVNVLDLNSLKLFFGQPPGPTGATAKLDNHRPVADAGPDQTATISQTVHLDATGSTDVDGGPLFYLWSFISIPPGSTAVLTGQQSVSPTFVVDLEGLYDVELEVWDGTVISITDNIEVSTTNSPATANAGPDQTAIIGDLVQLDGSASTDVDGDMLTYLWSLDSVPTGSTAALTDPTAVNPLFQVDLAGVYEGVLVVNDGQVDSEAGKVKINTDNSVPVADAGADQAVAIDDLVGLDGNASVDADNNPLSYQWSLPTIPEGSTALLDDQAAIIPNFIADVPGTYVGQLIVGDGRAVSKPNTVVVTTENARPVADAGLPQSVPVGNDVQLDGSNSDDANGDTLSYRWALIHKPVGSNAALANATTSSPGFVTDSAGLYIAQLIVGDGTVDSAPVTVSIDAIDTTLVISGISPNQASIGCLITVTGNNLISLTGVRPTVTLNQQNGGTINAPVSNTKTNSFTFTIPPGADTGVVTVTVDTQTDASTQVLTILPSSTFGLSVGPSSADVIQGQSVSYAVSLDSSNGFNQLSTLSLTGLPNGLTTSLSPAQIAAGQTSVLTIIAPVGQALGTAQLTVTATATVDGIYVSDTAALTLNVQPITTSFMGRTVIADTQQTSLAGVTVTLLGRDGNGNSTGCSGTTISDAAGNFAFTNLPPECTGDQLIRYDGLTVIGQPGVYAGVDLIYNIQNGQVTVSPVLVHLPRIDDKETVPVKQNWPTDQHFIFTSIPNLEVTVYAGTILTLKDGSQPDPFPLIAIDVPVDRLPEEMPISPTVEPFIVAFQPANAIASQPVAVSYPNLLNTPPGTQMPLSTLDPTKGVMVDYGTGTVSADGSKVIPDLDPNHPGHRYGLVHFDWHGNRNPPNNGDDPPPFCPITKSSQPVDYSSGIEVITATDIAINGSRGSLSLQRTYRTASLIAGPFGIGSNHNYGYRLDTNAPQNAVLINLIMPNGSRFPFVNGSNGFRNNNVPSLTGAEMQIQANGRVDLRWKNGTVFHFIPSTALLGSVMESISDANDNIIQLTRNPASPAQITEIIDPVGRKLTLNYDSASRIIKVFDPIGRVIKYTYNALGTLESVTDPENGVTLYEYSSADRLTKVTDARGIVVVQNTYNNDGRVIQQLMADGGELKIDYLLANPSLGMRSPVIQTTVTDPLNNDTVYRYSPQGALLDVTDPLGQSRVYQREPGTNQILAITGTGSCSSCGSAANGDQFFTYDVNGNLLTQTDALGNTTRYTYEPEFSKVASIADPLGHVTSFQYDAAGNLLNSTDQNNNTTSFKYNVFGLLTEITDPLGEKTTFIYDSSGNQIATTDALGNTSLSAYDAISRIIESTDALGKITKTQYDRLDHVVTTTDARGNATNMVFDAIGNLLSLTDARNNTTSFTYDTESRVKTRTDSNGKTETINYDLNGNLIDFTDRRGQLSNYSYDVLNRLLNEQYQDGSTVDRLYTPRSQLMQTSDSIGGIFYFNYDPAGRLLQAIGPNGTVVYNRDKLGRVKNRQVVGQDAVDYLYDPAGNLQSATMPQAAITSTYDARNQLKQQTRNNGVVTDYGYDNAGRLSSIMHSNGATLLETLTYIRDAIGNIIAKNSTNPQAYATQASVFNVESQSNRLTQRGNIAYTHDDNGNRLTETGPQGVKTYTWDSRNRLQSISEPNGLTQNFRYDFAGNLIEQLTQGPNFNDIYQYVLDDLTNVVFQENNNFNQLSVLTGRAIDQHFATTQASGTTEFALSDSINSTVLTTDANGVAVGQFSYDPFGKTSSTGSTFSYQFTGRVPVSNDLFYYRARFFDPIAGRFVGEDPIGFYGGVNLHVYVGNNTVNQIDPTGLFGVFCSNKDCDPVNKPPEDSLKEKCKKDPDRCGQLTEECHTNCALQCKGGGILAGICTLLCVIEKCNPGP